MAWVAAGPKEAAMSFHPARVPALSRRNYQHELVYSVLFPMAVAIVEGAIISVLVRNAFDGLVGARRLDWFVAVLAAAPEFGNITSFLWTRLSHGRSKIRLINALQWTTCLLVGLLALVPKSEAGLWALTLLAVAARVCVAGIFTLRSTIWRANYQRAERARVTGKFSTLIVLMTAFVGFVVSAVIDWSKAGGWGVDAFRLLVPVCALLGAIGASFYGRIRIRGHAAMLKAERSLDRSARPTMNPVAMARLLLNDRPYGWFMLFMFLLGIGNLMLTAPLVIALKERFGQQNTGGVAIASTLPLMAIPLFIPLWARLLSTMHVVRFRTIHSWAFVIGQALVFLGVYSHSLWLLYASAIFMGAGFAGGSLAWNLGHLDFAPSHKATLYMGIHVTLNGVRGIMAPFISTGLYRWFESRLGEGHGAWVFALSVVLCAAGGLGFAWLNRSMGEKTKKAPREV